MTHDFVYARANGLWKAHVIQRRRVRPVLKANRVTYSIKFISFNSDAQVRGDRIENKTC